MKRILLFFLIFPYFYNQTLYPQNNAQKAPVTIHYLGHSAFILSFDNGKTFLFDYGTSNAYGLTSPICDLNGFNPSIVVFSHHDADHDRGMKFENAIIVDGTEYSGDGIELKPILTSERKQDDNCGYLITYKGLKILYTGDSQGIISKIAEPGIRQKVIEKAPGNLDLLIMPIGWVKDIVSEAAEYAQFFKTKRILPVHYWSAGEKKRFLQQLAVKEDKYKIISTGVSEFKLKKSEMKEMVDVLDLNAREYIILND